MNNTVKNPKVFISYSWSGKKYEEKVLELACRLKSDGIVVVLDKWMIKPGTDNINFMEKCVKDKEIDYVLILLDKRYAEKANDRIGGVGVETQIISKEVYENVEETKFIPIVFDRDEDGNISVPVYLRNRFHIDFTIGDPELTYIHLVKTIFGKELYKEPALGSIPTWIDGEEDGNIALKFNININKDESVTLTQLLKGIKESKLGERLNDSDNKKVAENDILIYKRSIAYRNMLLDIFSNSCKNTSFIDNVLQFYEELKLWNKTNTGITKEIWSLYIHESFIYLIASLFNKHLYKEIYVLITKTYFLNRNGDVEEMTSNDYFYYSGKQFLDDAIKVVDDTNYYSGVANLWITNLYAPMFTKCQFVAADLLIHNLSILLFDEKKRWYWFPKLYIYGSPYYNDRLMFKEFSYKLKSKYEYNKMIDLFGGLSSSELKNKFKNMIEIQEDPNDRYRYMEAFDRAELIVDYIKPDEIGTLN